jgi:formylmethanofuran dehydrogenase subunit E
LTASGHHGLYNHPVKSLEDYLTLAAERHKHLCPGQVLGVRMAMLGLRSLGIADPDAHGKRLVTFVEIDRCATDAVGVVTGCSLGRRSLKYVDYGKVAATFVDLETGAAVRVCARDDSRAKAREMFPEIAKPHRQQMEAYKVMNDADLFTVENVKVHLAPQDLPGGPRSRVQCDSCGEGINHGREVRREGRVLCRACAGEAYYKVVPASEGKPQ